MKMYEYTRSHFIKWNGCGGESWTSFFSLSSCCRCFFCFSVQLYRFMHTSIIPKNMYIHICCVTIYDVQQFHFFLFVCSLSLALILVDFHVSAVWALFLIRISQYVNWEIFMKYYIHLASCSSRQWARKRENQKPGKSEALEVIRYE